MRWSLGLELYTSFNSQQTTLLESNFTNFNYY